MATATQGRLESLIFLGARTTRVPSLNLKPTSCQAESFASMVFNVLYSLSGSSATELASLSLDEYGQVPFHRSLYGGQLIYKNISFQNFGICVF